jgi:hypothetical protein
MTKTDICNYALSLIGEQVATDIENEDEGQHAVWANRLYLPTKREVLRMHTWGCARARVELAAQTAGPEFGYAFAYALPADCLRIVTINDIDPNDVSHYVYERIGGSIYTDEVFLKLDYVSANVTEDRLDALLAQCIYFLLASKLAWAIQQARTLREEMKAEFERALTEARYVDSTERKRPVANQRRTSNWVRSRYNSTNG